MEEAEKQEIGRVVGLTLVKPCPRCRSMLYRKKPCGEFKFGNYEYVLKCPTPGCGYMEGVKKEKADV